ncbi:tetratricopeptide repeat protein [Pontibacillus salicampi]
MQGIEEAIQFMNEGKSDKAIDTLRTELSRANDEEKYTIAEMFLQWGMTDDAQEILQDLKQKYPEEHELTIMLAEIYVDQEQDEYAIDLLNEITEESEEYLGALVQLADLYQSQGLFEVAEQKLLAAKDLAPNEPVIDFGLGELAFSQGEYQKSIPYYERSIRRNSQIGETEIPLRLAEAYAMLGDYEQSLDYFQATTDTSPDVLFRYGFTAYRSNRNDIAMRVWKKLIEEDPFYQSAYPLLAEAQELDGLIEEAYETAQKGLKKDEFNKDLYLQAGKLAFRMENKLEGYQLIRQAISLDPGHRESVVFLVERLKEDGDYEAIKDVLEHIMEMNEIEPMYQWELARANNELEYFNEALNGYEEAYNAFKDDSDFLKEYGYFLVEEGKVNEAHTVFSRYLEIEPTDEDVREFMSRFEANEGE